MKKMNILLIGGAAAVQFRAARFGAAAAAAGAETCGEEVHCRAETFSAVS